MVPRYHGGDFSEKICEVHLPPLGLRRREPRPSATVGQAPTCPIASRAEYLYNRLLSKCHARTDEVAGIERPEVNTRAACQQEAQH